MNTSSSCIPRILRRILCFGSLSSSSLGLCRSEEKDYSVVEDGSSTPGIVARLMGLKSLPKAEQIEQRDSRSSQWTDFPAYHELEDENFFILSFESRKKSKRRETFRQMNNENDHVNMVCDRDSDPDDIMKNRSHKNVLSPVQNSCRKPRKHRVKSRLQEQESENSSPNSVLEFAEMSSEHDETSSSGEFSSLTNTKLRRTLSEQLQNCGKNSEENQRFNNNVSGARENMCRKLNNAEWNCDGIWEQMGRLAATEMLKSNWFDHEISVGNQDYAQEIFKHVASEILDLLLDELMMILCF